MNDQTPAIARTPQDFTAPGEVRFCPGCGDHGILKALRQMLAPRATVLRDGRRAGVDAADLVPGDIVLLEAGDRVPADLRLLSVQSLRVEEAVLTGESVPVGKITDPVAADATVGETDENTHRDADDHDGERRRRRARCLGRLGHAVRDEPHTR